MSTLFAKKVKSSLRSDKSCAIIYSYTPIMIVCYGGFLLSGPDSGGKHAGGRPPKYSTTEELDKKIRSYFRYCDPHIVVEKVIIYPQKEDENGEKYTDYDAKPRIIRRKVMSVQQPYLIMDMCVHLGITRDTLLEYQKLEKFSDTIKKAKAKCEAYAERNLFIGKNVAGSIFTLTNNYGWKNKTEQENSGESKVVIETRHQSDGNDD